MATLQYSGIDALLTKNLLQVGDNVNDIKYISITNTSNNNVFVSLFLKIF